MWVLGTSPQALSDNGVYGKHALLFFESGILTLYLIVSVMFSNDSKSQFYRHFEWREPRQIRDNTPAIHLL